MSCELLASGHKLPYFLLVLKCPYLSVNFKDTCAGYSNIDWQLLAFKTQNKSFHALLTYVIQFYLLLPLWLSWYFSFFLVLTQGLVQPWLTLNWIWLSYVLCCCWGCVEQVSNILQSCAHTARPLPGIPGASAATFRATVCMGWKGSTAPHEFPIILK